MAVNVVDRIDREIVDSMRKVFLEWSKEVFAPRLEAGLKKHLMQRMPSKLAKVVLENKHVRDAIEVAFYSAFCEAFLEEVKDCSFKSILEACVSDTIWSHDIGEPAVEEG